MQYYLNGFRTGDPAYSSHKISPRDPRENVDILIVGCGPAGLTLATQLAAFPDISTRIIEKKSGPLEVGQADGVACRSIEMMEAFGLAERVLKEAYRVNEVAFWRPDSDGTVLQRADRIQDVEDDLSEMPHVILSQARIHDFYLEAMRQSPTRLEPEYNRELIALAVNGQPDHPIQATITCLDHGGTTETIRARYVVGCDGARSAVRAHLGQELKGEAARQLWGVMDILAVTNFPDIRLKAAIQSANNGSLLIIPREGGYLVRMYIELDALIGNERASDRKVSSEMLIEKARKILLPYTLDVKEVAWWSAYEIGQRVCERFDDVPDDAPADQNPRIFITGDACHTHSPKAGQGMNVSMADAFNLGWKLAAVLRGQAVPELLQTYSTERQAKAKELIDFDRDMARLFSAKPKNEKEAEQFQAYFKRHGRYTAGVETRYDPSFVTGSDTHQELASGFPVGMRFHSAPVIRLGDGKPIQLGHVLKADGRWRIIAFSGAEDIGQPEGKMSNLCDFLSGSDGPINRYTDKETDIDSLLDFRAVFQTHHADMQLESLPKLLMPNKGKYGLIDYEKCFCPDFKEGPDVFDCRGVDRKRGALLVVRPDQFVANVLPLNDNKNLERFLETIFCPIPQ